MICCALAIFLLGQGYAVWARLFPGSKSGKRRAGASGAATWSFADRPIDQSTTRTRRALAPIWLCVTAALPVIAVTAHVLTPTFGGICGHGWDIFIRYLWLEY